MSDREEETHGLRGTSSPGEEDESLDALQSESENHVEIPQASSAPDKTRTLGASADVPQHQALKEGQDLLQILERRIKSLDLDSSLLRSEIWDHNLTKLKNQAREMPQTIIGIYGASGAGKSSALNAILDANILPTSSLRACTAVITEISYHAESTIEAEVSFLSEKDWRMELAVLRDALINMEGEGTAEHRDAWSKIHAVYPNIGKEDIRTMDVDRILQSQPYVKSKLGTVVKISANSAKTFQAKLQEFTASSSEKKARRKSDKHRRASKRSGIDIKTIEHEVIKGQTPADISTSDAPASNTFPTLQPARGMLWPIVTLIRIHYRAKALETGAVLVDLPGSLDDVGARSNIASAYMKSCNCIWIIAPIIRAVNDKTAKDILSRAFRNQLLMDGSYDVQKITFIASNTDNISCTEVIEELGLTDCPELREINRLIKHGEHQNEKWTHKRAKLDNEITRAADQLQTLNVLIHSLASCHAALLAGNVEAATNVAKDSSLKRKADDHTDDNLASKRIKHPQGDSNQQHRNSSYRADHNGSSDDGSDSDSSLTSLSSSTSRSSSLTPILDSSDEDSDLDSADIRLGRMTMPLDLASLEERLCSVKNKQKILAEKFEDLTRRKENVSERVTEWSKKKAMAQKRKTAFCSAERSKVAVSVLQEDFREKLREAEECEAQERDPENFDPFEYRRDYRAINVPVYTCSAREYMRMTGQIKGDGESSCFSDVRETGIPDLQCWCHDLAASAQKRVACAFLTGLLDFADTIRRFVSYQGDTAQLEVERAQLKVKWSSEQMYGPGAASFGQTPDQGSTLRTTDSSTILASQGIASRLDNEFRTIVEQISASIDNAFKTELVEKSEIGVVSAREAAVDNCDKLSAKITNYMTYRATLVRHGRFVSKSHTIDWNADFAYPMIKSVVGPWSQFFAKDHFFQMQQDILHTIRQLAKEVYDSSSPEIQQQVDDQTLLCIGNAKQDLHAAVSIAKRILDQQQKDMSRSITSHIQATFGNVYDAANKEYGKGCLARQKSMVRQFVDDKRGTVFQCISDNIVEDFFNAVEQIKAMLSRKLIELSKNTEKSFAVLWESVKEEPATIRLRDEIHESIVDVIHQSRTWLEALENGEEPRLA